MTHRKLPNIQRYWVVLCLSALLTWVSHAQPDSPNIPQQGTIRYGQTVEGTITPNAIFDFWDFDAFQGDRIAVEMQGFDGLAPLIGVRAGTGDILIRSDIGEGGTTNDAPVNGVAYLEFEIPQDGTYTLVPTRAGTSAGDTAGSYRLTLTLIGSATEPEPPQNLLQPVEFRCGGALATTAATVIFGEDWDTTPRYRVTVFGFGGFAPVVMVGDPRREDCQPDYQPLDDVTISLPGADLTPEQLAAVQMTTLSLENARNEQTFLTIGSAGGSAGLYVIVIEGSRIAPAEDTDAYFVRLGPLAREGEMLVYMIRSINTRIDPALNVALELPGLIFTCDDAGRRECEDVPPATGLRLESAQAGIMLEGGMLDAGARLTGYGTDPYGVFMTSTNRAQGEYTVVIVGQLPPRGAGQQEN